MKARRVEDVWADNAKRGDFEFAVGLDGTLDSLILCCPGCGNPCSLSVRPGTSPTWVWDGNRDAPTLSPSIIHVGCWHGWLKNGELTSC